MLTIFKNLLKSRLVLSKFNSLTLIVFLICNILLLNIAHAENITNKSNIIVLGDSISSAYGIDSKQGWVSLLQTKLTATGYKYHIINASVSGDTTRTGLNRLKPLLQQHQPKIVIVALGGNDGLRGLPFTEIESSLSAIVELCQNYKSAVLLAGVRLPPNYGASYNAKFAKVYTTIKNKFNISLVPNLLTGVDEKSELMQADGIHPKAKAQPQMLQTIWNKLTSLLKN